MANKNVQKAKLIEDLRRLGTKEKVAFWKRIANDLSKPTRNEIKVNLHKINKLAKKDEIIVVPGKVLATGDLDKKVTVAAYTFSDVAKLKIQKSGKFMNLRELMKINPKAKKVRILA
ncbi:MAG: 50S ribosomal protein L18e [archaeon]